VRHSDPQVLALRALGAPAGDPADDAHLSACPRCQTALDELRGIVRTARSAGPADRPTAPPPEVWDRIVATLGPDLRRATAAPTVVPLRGRARLRRAITRPGPLAAAAGVVGLLAGVAATLLLGPEGSAPASPTAGAPVVVAEARLAGLPAPDGTGPGGTGSVGGTAHVQGTGATRTLVVDVEDLPGGDGYHEVWLLDRSASRLVSLGVLAGEQGRFRLPAGLDLTRFPVVDVSVEPYDGDPAHSADSVMRGTLRA
jgi:hypothetical protein